MTPNGVDFCNHVVPVKDDDFFPTLKARKTILVELANCGMVVELLHLLSFGRSTYQEDNARLSRLFLRFQDRF